MSLNVYLVQKRWVSYDKGVTYTEEENDIYEANITHNLGKMADEAGIYEALWRPHRLKPEYNIPDGDFNAEYEFESQSQTLAKDIIEILEKGLSDMKARPIHYQQFNASNGWGTYNDFIPWIEKYLEACKDWPESLIVTSR